MINDGNIKNIERKVAQACVESVLVWADGNQISQLDIIQATIITRPEYPEEVRQVMEMASLKQSGCSDADVYSWPNLEPFRTRILGDKKGGMYPILMRDAAMVVITAIRRQPQPRPQREIRRTLTRTFWEYQYDNIDEPWGWL